MHWLRGLRGHEHRRACVETERQRAFVEHDKFWDVPARGRAERRPDDKDAELKFRYSMYQSMLKAETHERLDPSRFAEIALVHGRRCSFEPGRWESFVRDSQERVRSRVRRRLISRSVPERLLEEMTEETTQEAWARACSSIGSFDPRRMTLDGWMQGVESNTVIRVLTKKRSVAFGRSDDFLYENVSDRCEERLAERVVRKRSNEEFERAVLPFLRSRKRKLVQKVLDDESLRGSDLQTWERNLTWMQNLCESRGWTP